LKFGLYTLSPLSLSYFIHKFSCLFNYTICPLLVCPIVNRLYRFCLYRFTGPGLYQFYHFTGPVPIGLF
jgi:hypothetical protein